MGHRSLIVAQAHEKYGSTVRIGPNELSFSDRACIKELYLRHSKFPKSGRYDGFATGTRASFDMTDPDAHRHRRHLVRHVLASSHIDQAEPLIADQVRKCMKWVERSQEQSVEIMLLLRRLLLDTAGLSAAKGPCGLETPANVVDRCSFLRGTIRRIGQQRAPEVLRRPGRLLHPFRYSLERPLDAPCASITSPQIHSAFLAPNSGAWNTVEDRSAST